MYPYFRLFSVALVLMAMIGLSACAGGGNRQQEGQMQSGNESAAPGAGDVSNHVGPGETMDPSAAGTQRTSAGTGLDANQQQGSEGTTVGGSQGPAAPGGNTR